MQFEKVAEVRLPSGRRAYMRAMIGSDILFVTAANLTNPNPFAVTLLTISRIVQIEGEPVTMTALLEMTMAEMAPILRMVSDAVLVLSRSAAPNLLKKE